MSDSSRRNFLLKSGYGFGGLALGSSLAGGGFFATPVLASELVGDPLAPKQPHFAAKVKSVIWLHQTGAPSTKMSIPITH